MLLFLVGARISVAASGIKCNVYEREIYYDVGAPKTIKQIEVAQVTLQVTAPEICYIGTDNRQELKSFLNPVSVTLFYTASKLPEKMAKQKIYILNRCLKQCSYSS